VWRRSRWPLSQESDWYLAARKDVSIKEMGPIKAPMLQFDDLRIMLDFD
jgi:hypothetical protein